LHQPVDVKRCCSTSRQKYQSLLEVATAAREASADVDPDDR